MTMVLLEAKGIGVPALGEASTAPLPGPLDIELSAGEALAILGPSGSGKTTALRCLALLEPRAQGSVFFREREVSPIEVPSFRRQVLYLPQLAPAFPMKVSEAIAEPFAFRSAGGKTFDRDRAKTLLDRLLLPGDVLERWTPDLSVGESQRVALARALLISPTIMLLDEFTSALDQAGLERAENMVREWLGHGERALVIVSHDEKQAERMATRSMRLKAPPIAEEEPNE